MALCRCPVSSFLIFACLVLVIDGLQKNDWDLSSNWTSEMRCPQIIEIYCVKSNIKFELLQWKADSNLFAEYTYNDSDTKFPIKLNSSIDGFEVTIINFSDGEWPDTYSVNSSLTAESDIIQNYNNIECVNGNSKGTIEVNFNCVDVYLQVNDTVEGEICPAGLNFSSIAMNVESIVWYLGENELINYTVSSESTQPLDLCKTQEKNPNLTDLCNSGGSLTINKVTKNGSRYDVVSILILTGTYIFDGHYLYVESGSNNITKTVSTNFTLVCVEVYLQVNDTVEGEVCPAGLNFSSIAMNVESIVWYLGENELINYPVSSESTQPLNLCKTQEKNSNLTDLCISGGSLTINKVTRNGSRYDVVSTLITTGTYISDRHYLYVKSGSNNITKTVSTNFTLVCVEVYLQVNDTVEGEVCPAGLNFSSIAMNVESIVWYLGENELINYPVNSESTQSLDLCKTQEKNSNLTDLCISGGSLTITKVTRNGSRYDVVSTLITTGTYIFDRYYLYVKSGSNNITKTVYTNFTLDCGPKNISINITDNDGASCDNIAEFACVGTDVPYFFWLYNETSILSTNYTYSPYSSFPIILNANILELKISISADTNNCSDKHFNFESKFTAHMSDFKRMRIKSIGCATDDQQYSKSVICNETYHWWYKLSFLDVLPLCHVADTKTFKENNLCFGVWGFVAAVIMLILLVSLCVSCAVCCYRCCKKKRSGEMPHVKIESGETLNDSSQILGSTSASPNGDSYSPVDHSQTKHETKKTNGAKKMEEFSAEMSHGNGSKALYKRKESASKSSSEGNKIEPPHQHKQPIQVCSGQPHQMSPGLEEKKKDVRLLTEMEDKDRAYAFSKKMFPEYLFDELKDLGSRLQKFWYLRKSKFKGKPNMLQLTVKVSQKCPLHLGEREFAALKELMECLKHPYLLAIHGVEYSDSKEFITLLVDAVGDGSLRDQLSEVEPLKDWSEKYQLGRACKFSIEKVAICGRHVLEAMLLLLEQGFPPIGQVHVGNIFFKRGRYVLGGYENCLLGYRASIYSDIKDLNLLDNIDLIMFGLMIYEIATGNSMDRKYIQEDHDFFEIEDDGLKDVLQCIFSEGRRNIGNQARAIRMILHHSFFKSDDEWISERPFELTREGCQLLSTVTDVQSGQSTDVFRVTSLKMAAVLTELEETYSVITSYEDLDNLGWRNGKGWAKVKRKEDNKPGLLIAIEVPHTCPVFVESTLSSFQTLLKHPCNNLPTIYDVHYLKIDQIHVLVLFQKFCGDGSLKDRVHNVTSPLGPWNEKYKNKGKRLSDGEIAIIGCEVLNIAYRLSLLDGTKFPLKLRFLHSGNIFKDGDHYVIGGFENMLLGCRPRNYVKFRNHLQCIDAVMFGHLIFELGSGYELSGVVPTDREYKFLSAEVRTILKYIFDHFSLELHEIASLDFFKLKSSSDYNLPKFTKGVVKLLLDKVKKEKRRDQDDTGGKIKYTILERPVRAIKEAMQPVRAKSSFSKT